MSTQPLLDNQSLREKLISLLDEYLPQYIAKYVSVNETKLKELSIIERIVRIEEELKHLRVLEAERHESLLKEMNSRFEDINSRFEAMNNRFEALQIDMNTRFEAVQKEMNTRFEVLQREMNTRFEVLDRRFSFMQWLIVVGIAILSLITALR